MKSTLELRPAFHRLEHRIRAHNLICWLALLLIRIAEGQTGHTWRRIALELQRRHQVTLSGPDGTVEQTTRRPPWPPRSSAPTRSRRRRRSPRSRQPDCARHPASARKPRARVGTRPHPPAPPKTQAPPDDSGHPLTYCGTRGPYGTENLFVPASAPPCSRHDSRQRRRTASSQPVAHRPPALRRLPTQVRVHLSHGRSTRAAAQGRRPRHRTRMTPRAARGTSSPDHYPPALTAGGPNNGGRPDGLVVVDYKTGRRPSGFELAEDSAASL